MSKEQPSEFSLYEEALNGAVNGDDELLSGMFVEGTGILNNDAHDPLKVIEQQVFEKQLHGVLSKLEDKAKVTDIFDRAMTQESSKPKAMILHFPTDRFKKPGLEGTDIDKIQ